MKKLIILLAGIIAISVSSYGFSDSQWNSGGHFVFKYYPGTSVKSVNYYLFAYNTVGRNVITATAIIDPYFAPPRSYTVVSYDSIVEKEGSVKSRYGFKSVIVILDVPLDTKGWCQSTISW